MTNGSREDILATTAVGLTGREDFPFETRTNVLVPTWPKIYHIVPVDRLESIISSGAYGLTLKFAF